MTGHQPLSNPEALVEPLIKMSELEESDPEGTAQRAIVYARDAASLGLHPLDLAYIQFSASSVVINCGSILGRPELLRDGSDLAESALAQTEPESPFHFQCLYNVANALLEGADAGLPRGQSERAVWEPQLIANRDGHRDSLRRARRLLHRVAVAETTDPRTRSAACCNLANTLDHSGRWSEAFDFYLRSLEAMATNGNAAGNLAEMLRHRLSRGVGQVGHIAAVHDKYVRLAQELRTGTVDFASASVADRWDRLKETKSLGHISHGIGLADPYREWIAQYRLALSPAVEGLGTDDDRWDTAVVERLFTDISDSAVPEILRQMNVLKADYLVDRRF